MLLQVLEDGGDAAARNGGHRSGTRNARCRPNACGMAIRPPAPPAPVSARHRGSPTAFDLFSAPGKGTVVLSRVARKPQVGARPPALPRRQPPAVAWSSAPSACPWRARTECGDAWRIADGERERGAPGRRRARAWRARGRGGAHGHAKPSRSARSRSRVSVMQNLNRRLTGGRGAVAACARLRPAERKAWNMQGWAIFPGAIVEPRRSRGMVSLNGTLGVQAPRSRQFDYDYGSDGRGGHAFGRTVGALAARRLSGPSPAACGGHRRRAVSRLCAQARRCHRAGRASSAMSDRSTRSRSRSARQELELAGLHEELAETNKGVVALYAELDQNALQLREAADLKSRFLSYMSHEFRTPLASITSVSDILLARHGWPADRRNRSGSCRFVQGSVRELSEMVDDLLDLAKVEAGRISISPNGSRWWTCSRRCAGCSGRSSARARCRSCSRSRQQVPLDLHGRQEAGADPAEFHLQCAEIHDRGRGAGERPDARRQR